MINILFIFIGLIFGIFISLFMVSKRTQAVLEFDLSDKNKPKSAFVLKIPYDDIFKYKIIKVEIKDVTELVRKNNEIAEKTDAIVERS